MTDERSIINYFGVDVDSDIEQEQEQGGEKAMGQGKGTEQASELESEHEQEQEQKQEHEHVHVQGREQELHVGNELGVDSGEVNIDTSKKDNKDTVESSNLDNHVNIGDNHNTEINDETGSLNTTDYDYDYDYDDGEDDEDDANYLNLRLPDIELSDTSSGSENATDNETINNDDSQNDSKNVNNTNNSNDSNGTNDLNNIADKDDASLIENKTSKNSNDGKSIKDIEGIDNDQSNIKPVSAIENNHETFVNNADETHSFISSYEYDETDYDEDLRSFVTNDDKKYEIGHEIDHEIDNNSIESNNENTEDDLTDIDYSTDIDDSSIDTQKNDNNDKNIDNLSTNTNINNDEKKMDNNNRNSSNVEILNHEVEAMRDQFILTDNKSINRSNSQLTVTGFGNVTDSSFRNTQSSNDSNRISSNSSSLPSTSLYTTNETVSTKSIIQSNNSKISNNLLKGQLFNDDFKKIQGFNILDDIFKDNTSATDIISKLKKTYEELNEYDSGVHDWLLINSKNNEKFTNYDSKLGDHVTEAIANSDDFNRNHFTGNIGDTVHDFGEFSENVNKIVDAVKDAKIVGVVKDAKFVKETNYKLKKGSKTIIRKIKNKYKDGSKTTEIK